ncbi:MAG: phosphate acyltransferase PlsX [Deltaproteobacteria bacterium]|nr:phosphate acyltransferase PlsX [Deltaproteobacteria bacterium]
MNIAVDAMGGDHGPDVIVQGALDAASELGVHVTLVGREDLIREKIGHRKADGNVTVHHCEEVVEMDESPLKAIRKKPDASIRVAFNLVRDGNADGVVSAGNSGATLAAGILTLGRLEGVERPAIASFVPRERGRVILIDVGANVDCRPAHLFQFGVMGNAYATACLMMQDPKIGLLSIGEEGSKGNDQVRLARELFEESRLNFVGNVEGRDIFSGDVQVVVCDGFVGNVALKVTEGMGQAMTSMLKEELNRSLMSRVGRFLSRKALRLFSQRLDYAEYGGAPLLGLKGVAIVCHGGSSPRAIRNGIRQAAVNVENQVLDKMSVELNNFRDFMV